jgi:hypothetical protein
LSASLLLVAATGAEAGKADVLAAEVRCRPAPGGRPSSVCQFTVTVKHADAGWDHYANRFEIVAPGGEVLSTRVLRHPHVDEQPFTRSQSRVRIPHTTESVEVRAGDLVHGLGGATVAVAIPHEKSPPSEEPTS